MKKLFLLGAVLMLLTPLAAQSIPISYKFHGEVTSVETYCYPLPTCESPVTVGEEYIGFLLYDVDTIVDENNVWGDHYGGIPFFSLIFDNFVIYGQNTLGDWDMVAADENAFYFWDETPYGGAGIYGGGDIINFGLYSNSGLNISSGQFPKNLDNISVGGFSANQTTWSSPYGESNFHASIEDFSRVSAVPEPPIALLIGSGLIGLIGLSRRKVRV